MKPITFKCIGQNGQAEATKDRPAQISVQFAVVDATGISGSLQLVLGEEMAAAFKIFRFYEFTPVEQPPRVV